MRRNFGEMHYTWQDRKTRNEQFIGFHITHEDGYEQDVRGGLVNIPASSIEEHGAVMKATAIMEGK